MLPGTGSWRWVLDANQRHTAAVRAFLARTVAFAVCTRRSDPMSRSASEDWSVEQRRIAPKSRPKLTLWGHDVCVAHCVFAAKTKWTGAIGPEQLDRSKWPGSIGLDQLNLAKWTLSLACGNSNSGLVRHWCQRRRPARSGRESRQIHGKRMENRSHGDGMEFGVWGPNRRVDGRGPIESNLSTVESCTTRLARAGLISRRTTSNRTDSPAATAVKQSESGQNEGTNT